MPPTLFCVNLHSIVHELLVGGEGRSMNKSPAQRHLRLVIMHVLKRMHDVPAIHRQAYEIFMAGQNLGACIIGILIFEENSVPRVFIANVLLIYIC